MSPKGASDDDATTVNIDISTATTAAEKLSCEDVLLELYWYMKHKSSGRIKRSSSSQPSMMMTLDDVIYCLRLEGILFWRDPRFLGSQTVALSWTKKNTEETNDDLSQKQQQEQAGKTEISFPLFAQLVTPCARLFLNAFNEQFVIPDWSSFVSDLRYFYEKAGYDTSGQTAQYIPILRDADPQKWGVAFCSVDGQRASFGDVDASSGATFSLQSVSKPVTYAMGLTKEGDEFMEQWIDVEPAGRPFNTQDLDPSTNRPFNASVNSGAIMSAGVVGSGFPSETSWRDIVDEVRKTWIDLCGGDESTIGFSDETFESEKATAYNNFAIAYNLKGRRGLPRDIDLHKMLDIYLGCCSIEITAEALSVAAATLANGGVCPLTEKEVFPSHVVRSVLAEMMTCGMYDQAGKFAVEVGLPSKSGVSGALMVIVPNLLGFATFSPRLNAKGNSVRGIGFCKQLVNTYRIHIFEPLHNGRTGSKIDPRQNGWKDEKQKISLLAWAANVGDEEASRMRRIFLAVLCTTSLASEEGLTNRRIGLIKDAHRSVFLSDVSDELLDDEISNVKKDSSTDYKYLADLITETPMTDAITETIFSAIVEIGTSGSKIDPSEKAAAIRIASMTLGMNEEVAELELKRYAKKIGHRFETQDIPDLIDNVHSVVRPQNDPSQRLVLMESSQSFSDDVLSSRTVDGAGGDQDPIAAEDQEAAYHNHQKEEAFRLHKQIVKLKHRLSAMKNKFITGRQDDVKKKDQRKTTQQKK